MKKITGAFLILLIVFVSSQLYIYANPEKVEVTLRIEGDQSTLMTGSVEADTLIKAIQKLGELSNVEVILKGNLSGQQLYSIGAIADKKYNVNDEWKAYILRNNNIIEVNDIMNTDLVNKDQIVLYYGNIDRTKRVTDIKQGYSNGTLSLELSSAIVTWVEHNGIWGPKTVYNKLKDVNVHMFISNKGEVIQKTNEDGVTNFKLENPNIYTYYLDGYSVDNVPHILKTEKVTNAIGIKDQSAITRAEFVALLVNNMAVKVENSNKRVFKDVTELTLYNSQIEAEQMLGLINGNGEGLFRPEDRLSMQELAIILNNIYKDKPNSVERVNRDYLKTCDEWAVTAVEAIIQKGIIKDYNIDWKEKVNVKAIATIMFEQNKE